MIQYERDFDVEIDEENSMLLLNAFGSMIREREKGVSGYYNLPDDSIHLLKEVENYIINEDGIYQSAENIVVIGIGGSSLGTKAVNSVLKHKYKNIKNLLFLENPDPLSISKIFSQIKKENSIFVVISKSGGTIETTSIFKTVIAHFDIDLNTAENKRVLVVTDDGSPLCKFADFHGIKVFVIPQNVGGRFSVLSAVGVVPLKLAGFDVESILKGAKSIMDKFFDSRIESIGLKALFYAQKKYPVNVLFSYADCLEDFTKWFVQLWAESLGKIDKEGEHTGLTPIGHIGSVDQHSFLQLIMQGVRDKTVTFIKVEDFENDLIVPSVSLKNIEKVDYINSHTFNELINAECDATKESLIAENIPVDSITLDIISEENVGEMIMYFELLTSYTGLLLGINTYNQPGVENGKKILVKKFRGDK